MAFLYECRWSMLDQNSDLVLNLNWLYSLSSNFCGDDMQLIGDIVLCLDSGLNWKSLWTLRGSIYAMATGIEDYK